MGGSGFLVVLVVELRYFFVAVCSSLVFFVTAGLYFCFCPFHIVYLIVRDLRSGSYEYIFNVIDLAFPSADFLHTTSLLCAVFN